MMRLEKLSFVSSSLVLNSLVPELLLELDLVLLFKKLAILKYYSLNNKYSPPMWNIIRAPLGGFTESKSESTFEQKYTVEIM